MPTLNAQKLQQLLITYSALGIFSISAIVALISIIPFYNHLRKDTERDFQFSLHTRRVAIDELLLQKQDIAAQITSRTRARQKLEDYYRGTLPREEIQDFTTKVLTDALNQTDNVRGITRLDERGILLTQVGQSIPRQFWQIPPITATQPSFSDPFQRDNKTYLAVSAPILNPQSGERVGTDIVLFDLLSLEKITREYSKFGETEEIILGAIDRDRVKIFIPQQAEKLDNLNEIEQVFRQGFRSQKADFLQSDRSNFFAFEPSRESNWGLVVKIERQELYASVNRQLMRVAIAIVFCCILGTSGTILLLRPLTGKVILRTDELEAQVRHKTQELEGENQAKTLALQELKRAQIQLIQQEKMATLGQLVSGIAHEINNPVSFIYGNITHTEQYNQELFQLLDLYQKHYPQPAEEIQEELEAIELDFLRKDMGDVLKSMKFGADRIRKIVVSLRNFSRLDEADLKEVDIHEGLQSTLMIIQSRLQATGDRPEIKVVKNYTKLPLIHCYPGLLNQVFINLMSNAIDTIEARNKQELEKRPGEIILHTEMHGDRDIAIHITDNGMGMKEEIYQQLFEPFFTTKTVGKGTGLGLSIAQSIIEEKHGGKLSCHSQWREGTTFTIAIPMQSQCQLPAMEQKLDIYPPKSDAIKTSI